MPPLASRSLVAFERHMNSDKQSSVPCKNQFVFLHLRSTPTAEKWFHARDRSNHSIVESNERVAVFPSRAFPASLSRLPLKILSAPVTPIGPLTDPKIQRRRLLQNRSKPRDNYHFVSRPGEGSVENDGFFGLSFFWARGRNPSTRTTDCLCNGRL